MALSSHIEITKLSSERDYQLAETGDSFVVPGPSFLASLSPHEPINYIAFLRYVEGQARANHYHNQKVEYLVVLEGELKCEFYLPNAPEDKYEEIVGAGSSIKINPGCVHIITALDGPASVLEMSPQKLDLADQIRM